MGRSNMFVNLENTIKKMNYEEKIQTTFVCQMSVTSMIVASGIESQTVGMIIESIHALGIGKGEKINPKKKEFIGKVAKLSFGDDFDKHFDAFFGDINKIRSEIPEMLSNNNSIFDTIKNLASIPGINMGLSILKMILCVAYCDNEPDEEVLDKLDGIFGKSLLIDFFASGQEEVPKPKREVSLSILEIKIINYLKNSDGLFEKDIYKHFSSESKNSIKKALDSLCDKQILTCGSTYVGNTYILVDENIEVQDNDELDEYKKKEKKSINNEKYQQLKSIEKEMHDWYDKNEKNKDKYLKAKAEIDKEYDKYEKEYRTLKEEKEKIDQEYQKKLDEYNERMNEKLKERDSCKGLFSRGKWKKLNDEADAIREERFSTVDRPRADKNDEYEKKISAAFDKKESIKSKYSTLKKYEIEDSPLSKLNIDDIKKTEPPRPITKNEIEELVMKDIIVDVLKSYDCPVTVSDLQLAKEKLNELSVLKIYSLLSSLIQDNVVIRETKGKKAYFYLRDTSKENKNSIYDNPNYNDDVMKEYNELLKKYKC